MLRNGMGETQHGQAAVVIECVNCGEPLDGPGAITRGPDTAWQPQCQELAAGQLELIEDRPKRGSHSDLPVPAVWHLAGLPGEMHHALPHLLGRTEHRTCCDRSRARVPGPARS